MGEKGEARDGGGDNGDAGDDEMAVPHQEAPAEYEGGPVLKERHVVP